ncbi:MAG: hypothetical protein P4M10_07860 [Verrucomicrobiae bacterium]|jgi:hypothetical protein|nr:hypothetical protein [Verrucomicrobiae bacterium]
MTANQQLELGFNGTPRRVSGRRRESRVARAQWWFAQMRAVVAEAVAWPPADAAAAEQSLFPGLNRQIRL